MGAPAPDVVHGVLPGGWGVCGGGGGGCAQHARAPPAPRTCPPFPPRPPHTPHTHSPAAPTLPPTPPPLPPHPLPLLLPQGLRERNWTSRYYNPDAEPWTLQFFTDRRARAEHGVGGWGVGGWVRLVVVVCVWGGCPRPHARALPPLPAALPPFSIHPSLQPPPSPTHPPPQRPPVAPLVLRVPRGGGAPGGGALLGQPGPPGHVVLPPGLQRRGGAGRRALPRQARRPRDCDPRLCEWWWW